MKTSLFARLALGIGGVMLVLMVAPATAAYAAAPINVPCAGPGGGAAGLIAAITTANSGGGGTINLAPGCTYSLTAPNNTAPMSGSNGLPVVTSAIRVNGFHTTIAANNTSFRIFQVNGPSGSLTLQSLTLTGGNSVFGGALLNAEGAVTLNFSQVTGNIATMGGGGIASGIVNPMDLGPIGTLTLNSSQVTNNTSQGGGGGGVLNHAGTLTANFSQVNNNTSGGGGGGIASGNANGGAPGTGTSNLTLFFTSVDHNTSNGGPMAGAGGIANGGSANIVLSQVNGNSAPGSSGGGILNHGTMTIGLSQVNNNTAASDSSGDAGSGGGIANLNFGFPNSGVLTINGSQVNYNSASGLGGGIAEEGFDSNGNPVAGGSLALNFSQVSGNTASGGGGGIYAVAGSPVTLKLSLVLRNNPDNCEPIGTISGCFH
jgi:hypothetical protein